MFKMVITVMTVDTDFEQDDLNVKNKFCPLYNDLNATRNVKKN
jgi:hypothetical protein